MINSIKKKLKEAETRRLLRRYFEPSEGFLEKSRAVFLSALRERFPEVKLASQSFLHGRALKYGLTFAGIVILLNGGMVVFADMQNVSASNPLYPYKRLAENVQLAVSPSNQQPVLRQKFAIRRLDEIKEAKNEASSSDQNDGKIKELSNDFKDQVIAALASVAQASSSPSVAAGIQNVQIQTTGTQSTAGKPSVNVNVQDNEDEGKKPENNHGRENGEENRKKDKMLCESIGGLISEHDEMVSSSQFEWTEFREKCGD